ncbi:dehydrogenase [Paenibacillus elgii]|uniref:Dehydrogenase n=1 Tax=Paenibacillus elgii TaxID=189691 RepID=A0A163V729_9BACL|nr:Gfo/Idh/MocA family oxidoreductase [Paenibacillus elgii]KZE74441.1 dehydrogenase [Paenibacillus elgii]
MKRKIGIIGLGDIAQKVYLPLLSASEKVDIVGLSSRSMSTVDRIGAQYRIAGRYASLTEMLRQAKPEAVFVHSPTETHDAIVTTCLKEGIHVYVDKPLAYDIEASERMAAYAAERGLLLAVGFNRRFAPLYVQAKRWIEEGGGFDLVTAAKHRTKLQSHGAKQTLYDDLIHMLDLLLWLGGDAFDVASYRQRTDHEGRLLFGAGTFTFGHGASAASSQDSAVAQFSMVRQAGADLEQLELHGNGRSAEVLNMETAVWRKAGVSPQEQTFGSWDSILHRRGFADAVDHFLACIADPSRCTIRADRTLPAHRLVEKLFPE